MATVDALNAKFGKGAVRCGLFPNSGAWRTRFERRSPAYTADWRQLMTACWRMKPQTAKPGVRCLVTPGFACLQRASFPQPFGGLVTHKQLWTAAAYAPIMRSMARRVDDSKGLSRVVAHYNLRQRYLACSRAGVEPKFRDVEVADPITYVLSLNLHRRHLTPSRRSLSTAMLIISSITPRIRRWSKNLITVSGPP